MIFTIVFVAVELPTDKKVEAVLTASLTTTDTGKSKISLGVFILDEATLIVPAVTVIDVEDNPAPSKCGLIETYCWEGKCSVYWNILLGKKVQGYLEYLG